MAKETFILAAPDRPGTLRRAAKVIASHRGNITRLSYNKAVDMRTVFLDVEASETDLVKMSEDLQTMGYMAGEIPESSVVTVSLYMEDRPGELVNLLDILERFDLSISYINSVRSDGKKQEFSMGVLFDDRNDIDNAVRAMGERYGAVITGRNSSENSFDNSIFYTQFSEEIREYLGLTKEESMEFLSEANRVLQYLQKHGENPYKVFSSIREFSKFIKEHHGNEFGCKMTDIDVAADLGMIVLEPVCGSNICIMRSGDSVTVVDCGYAVYHEEIMSKIRQAVPDWDSLSKRIYITHADIDHCGLLHYLEDEAEIWMNQKSADSLARQISGEDDYREEKEFCRGYSRLSRIITSYRPPNMSQVRIIDTGTPKEHIGFLNIGSFSVGPYDFDVLEGEGGHMYGECIFICKKLNLIFTGDLLLDIKHFSEDLRRFNSIAPYLMTTVDIDPPKAKRMRGLVMDIMHEMSRDSGRPCMAIGGHGPVFVVREQLEPVSQGSGTAIKRNL